MDVVFMLSVVGWGIFEVPIEVIGVEGDLVVVFIVVGVFVVVVFLVGFACCEET